MDNQDELIIPMQISAASPRCKQIVAVVPQIGDVVFRYKDDSSDTSIWNYDGITVDKDNRSDVVEMLSDNAIRRTSCGGAVELKGLLRGGGYYQTVSSLPSGYGQQTTRSIYISDGDTHYSPGSQAGAMLKILLFATVVLTFFFVGLFLVIGQIAGKTNADGETVVTTGAKVGGGILIALSLSPLLYCCYFECTKKP